MSINIEVILQRKRLNSLEKQNIRKDQKYRSLVQWLFVMTSIWIGIEFIIFVHQLEIGSNHVISRPPGVEAFLPISSLISLKYWLMTGIFNKIHPSGLVLLLIIISTGLFLKKGFCSWVCPFGYLSQALARVHKWVFPSWLKMPRWLDIPLRSIKYLLMFFFVYFIFFKMDVEQLRLFIYSPYNRVADIKMLYFFEHISAFSLKVIVSLILLSIVFPYFWCRYLCPYGALLGIISLLSPFKVRRNENTCIDCTLCTKACPMGIQVHKKKVVYSDECHSCLQCVAACPVKNTLEFSTPRMKWTLSIKQYALIILGLFIIGTTLARVTGYWKNNISVEEYRYHIKHLHSTEYYHNRGRVAPYDHQKWLPKEQHP